MRFGDILNTIIKEHGRDVLDRDILWGILLDNGIRNNRDISPAQQTIIKELCKEGVFQRIYRDCSETRWELTFRQLSHHIISDNGRQEQLVNGLFLEIATALGFDVNATEWGKNLSSQTVRERTAKKTGANTSAPSNTSFSDGPKQTTQQNPSLFGSMIVDAISSFARSLANETEKSIHILDSTTNKKAPSIKKTTAKKDNAGTTVKKATKKVDNTATRRITEDILKALLKQSS